MYNMWQEVNLAYVSGYRFIYSGVLISVSQFLGCFFAINSIDLNFAVKSWTRLI